MGRTGSSIRRLRTRLGRWHERDWSRRIVLVRAAVLVVGFRAALRLLPFSRVMGLARELEEGSGSRRRGRNLLVRLLLGSAGSAAVRDPVTVGRDVEAAARVLAPGRPCLPQALACHVLLRRAGQPATLFIGVRRPGERERSETSASRTLDAHAWVESKGRVVAGGQPSGFDGPAYRPLMTRSSDPVGEAG